MLETRLIRIRQFLREQISRIVMVLKDPRLQTGLVTITGLEVAPDLRHARVSYSVLGSADARRACGEALTRAAPFIRRELLRVTELRRAPELEFLFDESTERASRVFELLAKIEEERAPASPEPVTRAPARRPAAVKPARKAKTPRRTKPARRGGRRGR